MESEPLASSSRFNNSCWASDVRCFGFIWATFPPPGKDDPIWHLCSYEKLHIFRPILGHIQMWTSKLRGASCLPVFSHRGPQAGFTLPHLQMWICFRGSLNHYFALLASITDGDLAVGAGQTVLVAWLHGALLMHQWLLCTCAVFRAHRKSQKSLLNSNVAKKKKEKKKIWTDIQSCGVIVAQTNSQEEEEDVSRGGCRTTGGQSNTLHICKSALLG